MTSKIKVDNINKVSDDSTIIKKCGSTTTVGSGSGNTIVVDGSAITLGRCGGTVALASGATQTGFGRTGTVDWQTSSIKTATFTAANGEGYFANTSGSAFTMNLPAGTAGNIVSVVDYTNTFQTNNLTIAPNGSQKIGGVAATVALSTEGQSVTFVYVDDIEGWKNTMDSTSNVTGLVPYIVASGGTETTSGDFKIHTFTSPGTFTVSCASTVSPRNGLEYLVVGGGGGGRGQNTYARGGGGGGAGGYRTSAFGPSPLQAPTINAAAGAYPVTVGAGGTAGTSGGGDGGQGANSIFAGPTTITSTGGGAGRGGTDVPGQPGGSGGGAGDGGGGTPFPGGTGNTPPVSPPQGNNGGTNLANPNNNGGGGAGGGGAGGAGDNESSPGGYPASGSAGGPGVPNAITGSGVTYAAGAPGGPTGNSCTASGPANSGNGGVGGGGSYGSGSAKAGGAGGSGIVVIRYRFQN